MSTRCELGDADRKEFARDAKIGLLATVDPDGRPHVTLITSIQARAPRELMFGQFIEGMSKANVRRDPKVGFLVLTPERELWRGSAEWTHAARSGEDYELYNRKPMFRYNAYFGIHTVHYLDLVALAEKERLSALRLGAEALAARVANPFGHTREHAHALTPWTEHHLHKVDTLKFMAWVGKDGYPVITPPVACRAADEGRLAFRALGRADLDSPEVGQSVAVFAVDPEMESVLVRGSFAGWRRHGGVATAGLDVDWVYNSMPPKHGQIHPPLPLAAVTAFGRP
jgi:hypothetical protein